MRLKNPFAKITQTWMFLFSMMIVLIAAGCNNEDLNSADSESMGEVLQAFQEPPDDCRPKVLWDWMGGLISKEGITADLESMKEVGIGGVMIQQMPDQCPFPRRWSYSDYPGKAKCLSDEWFDMVNFAIGECDRLGLDFGMFICPGWSHCGSPAITPEKGLKKLVTIDVFLEGPLLYNDQLPQPAPLVGKIGGNLTPQWSSDYHKQPRVTKPYYQDVALLAFPAAETGEPVSAGSIIELTEKMDESGNLHWSVPEGKWRVTRIGMASDNGMTHPAPVEGTGLECDRFDPEAVELVFDEIVGRVLREAKAKGYDAFKVFESDSYESGSQDFGSDFQEEFLKRRGYDCTPWLPVWKDSKLVIDSEEQTGRFRFDMQQTINELWTERFHGTLRKLGDANDLIWSIEPYFTLEIDWRTSGAQSRQPGSCIWVKGSVMDERGTLGPAAGINALYGQPLVWAEIFTAESDQSAWRNDPWLLKPFGDRAFCEGINEFYMHGFVHNPFDNRYQPGLTMGYWGTQFSRHQTWWPMSHEWHRYLARCHYMLRQGLPVIDVLKYPQKKEHLPKEFTYAGMYRQVTLNDETLMERLTVESGRLVLPNGNSFAALIFDADQPVRPEALKKIQELVTLGATVIGNPPLPHPPGLEYGSETGQLMKETIDTIWGGNPPGTGKVLKGQAPEIHLDQLLGGADFICPANTPELMRVRSMHRKLDQTEFWFVAHLGDEKLNTELRFRITGMVPEFWDPVTGQTRLLPDYREEGVFTVIPFEFAPRESGFFIFSAEKRDGLEMGSGNTLAKKSLLVVEGPWRLNFDQAWGGPAEPVTFETLTDWTTRPEKGIRHYSGIAEYEATFDAPGVSGFEMGKRAWISLGSLKNVAQVFLNGEDLGTAWCAPWQVEVPVELLKARGNLLLIKVANTWVNRLIGDEQEPEDCELAGPDLWFSSDQERGHRMGGYNKETKGRGIKDLPDWLINNQPRPSQNRYTFTAWRYYDAAAPLLPSGLYGPVELLTEMK